MTFDSQPLQRAVLELDADVDKGGGKNTGVFEMVGDLEVQEGMTTNYTMLSGGGSALNAITTNAAQTVDDLTNAFPGDQGGPDIQINNRAGFALDLGGGRHTFEINFLGWEGAQRPVIDESTGTVIRTEDVQWGDGFGDPGEVSMSDATGADPLSQLHVLTRYLRVGEYDSREVDARLRWGEYSDGSYADNRFNGVYENFLHVTVRNAQFTRVSDSPVAFNGSIKLMEVKNWTEPLDALFKTNQ
jgi:hypothetical protein